MLHQRHTILVVDDHADTRAMLRMMLKAAGFNVLLAADAISGLKAAYQHHPDAVLLDVMMPKIDGFETCRRLRELTNIPVLFLTANNNIDDKIHGLSLGADDYIIKPFNHTELKYRLMSCLKRSPMQDARKAQHLFLGDAATLDCERHKLQIKGQTLYLTPKEFKVLRYLARHRGSVLHIDAILTNVWGVEHIGDPALVKQYIYRLRRKLATIPDCPLHIQTIWGTGYYFEADTTPLSATCDYSS